jgi:hypothetical protein
VILEIHDRTGASRLGQFNPEHLLQVNETIEENGVHTLNVEVLQQASAAFEQTSKRCQVWLTDVAGSTSKFVLMRKGRWRRVGEVMAARLECDHLGVAQLGTSTLSVGDLYSNAMASALLTRILADSGWSVGTVSASLSAITVPEFEVGGIRLENLRRLADVVDGSLLLNDDLTVDLLVRKSLTGAPDAVFHSRKNLLDLDVMEDCSRLASKLYALGGGTPRMTLSGAWHPVEEITGTLPSYVKAYFLAPSSASLSSAGGWTYYVRFRGDTTNFQVAAFEAEYGGAGNPDRIRINGAIILPVSADANQIMLLVDRGDGAGIVPLDHLVDYDAYTDVGWVDGCLDEGDLAYVENLIFDPFFSRLAFASGKHPNLEDTTTYAGTPAATFSENTDALYIQNGSRSQKVVTTGYGSGCYFTVDTSVAGDPDHWSVKLLVYLEEGEISVDVTEGDWSSGGTGNRGNVWPPDNAQAIKVVNAGWHTIKLSGLKTERGHSHAVWIYQRGDVGQVATFYLDSVSVEPTASLSEEWIEGSTRRQLWVKAYHELRRRRIPVLSYECKVADLGARQPERYPYDSIAIGNVAAFEDPALGVTDAAWIKSIERDHLNPVETSLTVQTYTEAIAALEDQVSSITVDLERTQRRLARFVSAVSMGREVSAERTAVVMPKAVDGNVARMIERFGSGQDFTPRIAYWGEVTHGCQVLNRLSIPTGYVGLLHWSLPTETGKSTMANAGTHWFDEAERWALNPTWDARFHDDRGFALLNNSANPIAYIKAGVVTSVDYNSVDLNRRNFFGTIIPAGDYTSMIAVLVGGDQTTPENATPFAASLIIAVVPARRAFMSTDHALGSASLTCHWSSTHPSGGPIFHRGLVRVGEGPRSEIATIVGGSQSSGPYNENYHELASGETLLFDHPTGTPVMELASGSAGDGVIERIPAKRTVTVWQPAVTYA